MANFENVLVKEKKLGTELLLKVYRNEMAGRIFVEFKSIDGKLTTQKSFQDNYEGNRDAALFQKKFKSLKDLRKHFGIDKK